MNHRLFDRFPGSRKKHDRRVRTICQECTVRCGLIAYLQNGAIVDIHGDDAHPVSRGRLCARGLAFIQGLDSPARITSPAFRHTPQDPFEPWEDWEKALDGLAEQLRKIKDHHGAESIVVACDPETDLDFAIGAARFAALLGTPQVYPPFDLRQNHPEFPWPPYPVPPYYEWGNSQFLFFIEADPATTHPVAFGWALEAQQQGAKLIVADSRFTRTMAKADLALRILPGSGNVLGLALTKMVLERSDYNDAPAKARFINPETWRASFDRLSFEDLENTLGLSPKGLRPLSDLLPGNHPTTIVTGKALAALPTYGIWPTLMTALGCGETKGSGWVPLAGTTPPLDPTRGITAGVVQKGPQDKEDSTPETIKEPGEISKKVPGTAKAILYWGNCLGDLSPFLQGQTKGPDLMACFGAFPEPTQGLSQMIFPSTLWPEKSGLCFSNDRAIQWAEKIVEPRPGCRTGLDFWSGLAKRFGWSE
ncbi:MAG: molybdopterin-dependent oxidoreductase, partial [Pseudomonadota bacterium]